MLGKLVKYEAKQTAKFFLPIFGGIAVLGVLTKIMLMLGSSSADGNLILTKGDSMRVADTIANMLLFFILLAMVALVMGTIIITVQRFYKNLLGDEGYLMFTLPVTAAQHIWAKLLVGTLWTLASIVLLFGGMLVLSNTAMISSSMGISTFSELLKAGAEQFGASVYWLPLLMLAALIMGILDTYLMLYTSMAIGAQWPQSRALASILAYFSIQAALQVLSIVGATLAGLVLVNTGAIQALNQWANTLMYQNPISMVNFVFLGMMVLLGVGNVIYFFVTRWLLSKKLNLA